MRAGLDDLLEPGAGGRAPLGGDEVLTGQVCDEVSHVVVAEGVEHGGRDRRSLGAHALGVGRLSQPLARALRDRGARELGAHDARLEEVRLDELAERAADLVLAVRDDRGVRDRQAEWTTEQRGHGEPVGEGTHHAAFGGGAHIAEPRLPFLEREREDEDLSLIHI